MATAFRRTRRGITTTLQSGELRLLDVLLADVAALLTEDAVPAADPLAAQLGLADLDLTERTSAPTDPALARLLPDASRDDPASAADFRRYTERGLRRRKVAGLVVARRTLGLHDPGRPAPDDDRDRTIRLDDAEARAWVVALTDLRLVLADRLGLQTDEDAEALHARLAGDEPQDLGDDDEDDEDGDEEVQSSGPAAWLAAVYDFVSWLQESLTEVLLEALPPQGDGRRPRPPGLDG